MRIIEESKLKKNISQLNNYKKANKLVKDYYNNLDSLKLTSLQSLSYDQDIAFFDEVSFILNVIASIISHPHLSNKGEDIVIRSELAGHISVDSFQRMFKEPSFWKEKDLEMKPEYVHHYQYTDEIKIFENIFIGMIIKLIDQELNEYSNFYNQLIPSIEDNNLDELLENEDTEIALNKLQVLQRKVRYIKNTYFYKEVSKVKLLLKNIQPTNILVKDRLYNYCYRFYKKFIQYVDQDSLIVDFSNYYYGLVIKALKKKGFSLEKGKSKVQAYDCLYLSKDKYYAQVKLEQKKARILLQIGLKEQRDLALHCLILSPKRDYENNSEFIESNALTNSYATLWNIKEDSDLGHFVFKNVVKEKDIAQYFVNSKLEERHIKQNMFTKYCPVCKSSHLEEDNNIYTCLDCDSKYMFIEEDLAWFLKLRRL